MTAEPEEGTTGGEVTVESPSLVLRGVTKYPGVTVSEHHLDLGDVVTEQEAFQLGRYLAETSRSIQWILGDFFHELLRRGFSSVYESMASSGTKESRRRLKMVSAAFPPEYRHPRVSHSGHLQVLQSGYPGERADTQIRARWLQEVAAPLLEEAAAKGWSCSEIQRAARKLSQKLAAPKEKTLVELPDPKGLAETILSFSRHQSLADVDSGTLRQLLINAELLVSSIHRLLGASVAESTTLGQPIVSTFQSKGEDPDEALSNSCPEEPIATSPVQEQQVPLEPPTKHETPHVNVEGAEIQADNLDHKLETGLQRVKDGENLYEVANSLRIPPKVLVEHRLETGLAMVESGKVFSHVVKELRLDHKLLRDRQRSREALNNEVSLPEAACEEKLALHATATSPKAEVRTPRRVPCARHNRGLESRGRKNRA